jgi:hypothetical protein
MDSTVEMALGAGGERRVEVRPDPLHQLRARQTANQAGADTRRAGRKKDAPPKPQKRGTRKPLDAGAMRAEPLSNWGPPKLDGESPEPAPNRSTQPTTAP